MALASHLSLNSPARVAARGQVRLVAAGEEHGGGVDGQASHGALNAICGVAIDKRRGVLTPQGMDHFSGGRGRVGIVL